MEEIFLKTPNDFSNRKVLKFYSFPFERRVPRPQRQRLRGVQSLSFRAGSLPTGRQEGARQERKHPAGKLRNSSIRSVRVEL
jgi:hypothetical protein